jgi:hypothetical protein
MLRSPQHGSAVLLPRYRHLRIVSLALTRSGHPSHSSPHSPRQYLMGFYLVDAYWATLAVAPAQYAIFRDYSPTLLTFHIQNFLLFRGVRYTEFNGY